MYVWSLSHMYNIYISNAFRGRTLRRPILGQNPRALSARLELLLMFIYMTQLHDVEMIVDSKELLETLFLMKRLRSKRLHEYLLGFNGLLVRVHWYEG